MSVNRGLPGQTLLTTLCVLLGACRDEAPAKKVDPEQPVVQRPRRPEPRGDSPFRDPAKEPPEGRDGEQIPEPEIEATLAKAKTAAEAGERTQASQMLLACANKTPASARCDGELGLLLSDVSRRDAEAGYFLMEAARTDDPKADADLYGRVAVALRKRGQLEDAVTAAERAVARDDTAERHAALGRTLQSIPEQLPRAAEEMGKAFELDATKLEFLQEQATVLGQIMDADSQREAATLFQKYLEQAKVSDQDKAAIEVRIGELKSAAERIARDEKAAAKKSG